MKRNRADIIQAHGLDNVSLKHFMAPKLKKQDNDWNVDYARERERERERERGKKSKPESA